MSDSCSEDCPLCGGVARLACTAQAREFHACPRCDLIFVPPRFHLSPADERRRYEQHRNSIDSAGYVAMLRRSMALLHEYAPEARRVLDYGSGPTPVMVELLRNEGYAAVGYDPFFAPEASEPERFDAVLSIETFEHFCRPRGAIDDLVGRLKDRGILVVQTRLHPGPEAIADWWYAWDPTHVAFYSARTMDWIARQWSFTAAQVIDELRVVLRLGPERASTAVVDS